MRAQPYAHAQIPFRGNNFLHPSAIHPPSWSPASVSCLAVTTTEKVIHDVTGCSVGGGRGLAVLSYHFWRSLFPSLRCGSLPKRPSPSRVAWRQMMESELRQVVQSLLRPADTCVHVRLSFPRPTNQHVYIIAYTVRYDKKLDILLICGGDKLCSVHWTTGGAGTTAGAC